MKNKVGIIGVGSFVPKKVLNNSDLEKMVDTSDEWIITRTGIKERRIAPKNCASSDLAVEAAKKALKSAKLDVDDLELIIVATITPDMQFPATACFVQKSLQAKNAVCFDISAACSGQLYAMVLAEKMIASGQYKNALVLGCEVLSSITDWKDRSTCVLFGDGAGACVLSKVRSGGIISSHLGSDGSFTDLLMVPGGGSRYPASAQTLKDNLHCIKMRGNELFKHAVRLMVDCAEKALKKADIKGKDIKWLIPHQANVRILSAAAKRLGISEDKIFLNIQHYGNMSSASLAVALAEAAESGRIKKGDYILLDAFGAGLVWGAAVIKWSYTAKIPKSDKSSLI